MNRAPAGSVPVDPVGIAPGESVRDALVRIGHDQFERIGRGLAGEPDRDTGVHEARKALKRLRALLRLVLPHLDAGQVATSDVLLRDVGRTLAPLRDACVSLDLLDEVAPGVCPGLRAVLEDRHHAAANRFDAGARADLAARAGGAAERWVGMLAGSTIEQNADVVPGIGRTYRRGRKRMRRALRRGSDADFHEWRKEVKYLRYQLEALRPLQADLLGPRIARLDILGERLGLEHDLTVLIGLVESQQDCGDDRVGLLALLCGRRTIVRDEACPMGERVFTDGKAAFIASLSTVWGASTPADGPVEGTQG